MCRGATADQAATGTDQHRLARQHLAVADAGLGAHLAAGFNVGMLDEAGLHIALAAHARRGLGLLGAADDAALDDQMPADDELGGLDRAVDEDIAADAHGHAGAHIALHVHRAIETDIAGLQIDVLHLDLGVDADAAWRHRGQTGNRGQQQIGLVRRRRCAADGLEGQIGHLARRDRLAAHIDAVAPRAGGVAAHQRCTRIDDDQRAVLAIVDRTSLVAIALTGLAQQALEARRRARLGLAPLGDQPILATAARQGLAQRRLVDAVDDALLDQRRLQLRQLGRRAAARRLQAAARRAGRRRLG